MVNNQKIINEFEKLIEQIKYDMDRSTKAESLKHSFRLRQIRNVLKILKKYNKTIRSGTDLKDIKGVGKGTIERIDEILKTGKLSEIKVKRGQHKNEASINELEQIFGIGRKKAYELVVKYNIKSVKDLKKAYKAGKIELTEQMITSLKYYGKYKQAIPRNEIKHVEKIVINIGKFIDRKLTVQICGSYRREKDTSNDIDILITHPKIKTKKQLLSSEINYLHKFIEELKKIGFILDDLTFDDYETKYMGYCRYKNNPVRRIDIYYFPFESYYPALLHLTGSGEFNRKMRAVAIELGYRLNEYGLFKINGKMTHVIIKSEKDIFDRLGLEYVEPKNR